MQCPISDFLDFGDCFIDGFSDIIQVLCGQTTHVDTATGHQVDVFLLDQVLYLFNWKGKRQNVRSSYQKPQATFATFHI